MTRLPESSSWEDEIELISRSERVSGGLDGVANRPLKSLANRTRYLKEKADKSDGLIAEKVSAVKTFAEGATLESPREEILYGAYRLVWTGEFPKTVPAASTPGTTGGVGAGLWAYTSDAALRSGLISGAGFKLVGQFESTDALRGYSPSADGESVLVKSYHPGWSAVADSPRGGGEFYYDATDTTSSDDGVFTFVTVNGARLKRRNLNGAITLAQAGAPVDGLTNADEAFSRLHNAIMSRADLWRVDGENLTYVRTTPLLQDISRYSVNNMYLMFDGVTDFSADTPFYAWRPSDSLGANKRTFTRKMKDVTFQGPGYRIDTNIHALLLHMETESESLRQMKFENVNIRDFNKGHIYGDHAYLITFENCNIWRCFAGLSDREVIEGVAVTDSGENIRYNNCLLDSLHQLWDFGTKELILLFDLTSFDYTGRTAAESYNQGTTRGTHKITIRDCFTESGNENAGWYGFGFYTTAASNIRFIGGVIRLVSTTYNSCPFFFYDTSGLASFEIDGTTINGWGVKQWANTGLRKFRPVLKGVTSQFTLKTTNDPILCNPDRIDGLDYQVRGLTASTYTSRYVNDRIKVEQSSVTKSDGTVVPSLKITKIAGWGTFCDFIVKFRRPVKADHNSIMKGKIAFVPGTNMSSARDITAITGCCNPGALNNVGVMTQFESTTITSTSLSLLDTSAWYEINSSWGANKSAQFLRFEYDMIRLDLTNLAAGDAMHLLNVEWYGAF
ncbi:hypothetical protein ACP6PD_07100 [Klebsiella pneumoniae]|uniref:tail fiber/spike domain-containing protein n=1 Tax=Klebsiella pneumoniae TaxID=573 RepID=UPI003B5B3DCE